MDAEGFNSVNAFGGFGIKKTFYQRDNVDWGAAFQIYWSAFHDDILRLPGWAKPIDVDLSYQEIQFAIGPTYKGDNWHLYGGPFLHLLMGDMDFSTTVEEKTPGGIVTKRVKLASFDVERDLSVGGFAGLSVDLTKDINLGVEAQFIEDAQAMVFKLGYRF